MAKEIDSLNEYRSSIQRKKERIRNIVKAFEGSAEETDEFKRVVSKTIIKYGNILEDLFNNIEMFAILNSGLKDQSELLKDILMQIPGIKDNPQIQSEIQRAFGQYNEIYRRQQESFRRHSDESEKR